MCWTYLSLGLVFGTELSGGDDDILGLLVDVLWLLVGHQV